MWSVFARSSVKLFKFCCFNTGQGATDVLFSEPVGCVVCCLLGGIPQRAVRGILLLKPESNAGTGIDPKEVSYLASRKGADWDMASALRGTNGNLISNT